MNKERLQTVERLRNKGLIWVRELSTSAYYRYCYDRRFGLVKPEEHKEQMLVFITEEQFNHYEHGEMYVHKRRKQD